MEELFQNKDIYRTATFLKQVLLRSNNFFKTDTFQQRYFFKRGTSSHIILRVIVLRLVLLYYNYYYCYCIANFSEKQYSALPNLSGEPVFQSR